MKKNSITFTLLILLVFCCKAQLRAILSYWPNPKQKIVALI